MSGGNEGWLGLGVGDEIGEGGVAGGDVSIVGDITALMSAESSF